MRRLFGESAFADRAGRAVGCGLPGAGFTAEMTALVEGGAEGIDISPEQDVFGIEREPEWAFRFIAHEYVIFLLRRALAGEDAFRSVETWAITAGLAEHYLQKALGGGAPFGPGSRYADFFTRMNGSPAELYRAAKAWKR